MPDVVSGMGPDSGMLGHLRELSEAEPFKGFTISVLGTSRHIKVEKKEHIEFTHFWIPKVYDFHRAKWILLNVDSIGEIIL